MTARPVSQRGGAVAKPTGSVAEDLRALVGQGVDSLVAAMRNTHIPGIEPGAVTPSGIAPTQRTLRFEVCNGFANQRLSVVYGIMLAVRLNRVPVLPVLVRDGIQRTDAAVTANGDRAVSFDQVYDAAYFLSEMAKSGVRVLPPEEAPLFSVYNVVALGSLNGANMTASLQKYDDVANLAIDCPLFKLAPAEMDPVQDEPIIWAILDAMRPAPHVRKHVESFQAAIRRFGGSDGKPAPKYNFLHLRMENDWVEHCKRWSSIPDGVVRDNCYNNTEEIDVQLRLFAFNTQVPLYIASFWDDVDPVRKQKVFGRLAAADYKVVTSDDVFSEELKASGREMRALVEYFVGFGAVRFLGNSVSTFAVLNMLERRHRNLWAAYYNGGNLPIAPYLPVHKLAWVFTYNSWSAKYDYMLKAAVISANSFNTLRPFCIFDGNVSSPIGRWLAEQNVTLIVHVPTWRQELIAKAQARMKDNVQHSHLFKNPDMLVSTFQRVDLPVVPILDQYTYVLYTDADVYFRRPIHLEDFGLPLPRSVSMSYEMDKMFPYNAGIILANLPTMRRNYKAFLHMMLDNDNGLYYPNYGPADQGIINKFYEFDLRSHMLSQAFNTKPYNPFDPASFLIHFHGPKPHDYLELLQTGKCDFGPICERGILSSLCLYTKEWASFIPDEDVASRLSDSCFWLTNPHVISLLKKSGGIKASAHHRRLLRAA